LNTTRNSRWEARTPSEREGVKGGRRKELFAMREEGKRTSEGADGEAQHPRVRMDKRATEGAETTEWAPQPRVRA